jgi:hypothetical protein
MFDIVAAWLTLLPVELGYALKIPSFSVTNRPILKPCEVVHDSQRQEASEHHR